MDNITGLSDLARQSLAVLNTQQQYFRAKPGTAEKERLLLESKQKEAELRKTCTDILVPPSTTSLFDDEDK